MQKHIKPLTIIIVIQFCFFGSLAFGQSTFWKNNGTYFTHSDAYKYASEIGVSRDGKYMLMGSESSKGFFVSKYNFRTGEIIKDFDYNKYYPKQIPNPSISSDNKTYGLARSERIPQPIAVQYNLLVDLYDIETDSLILTVVIDSLIDPPDNITPTFNSVRIDYSSADSVLFVSYKTLQGKSAYCSNDHTADGCFYRIQFAINNSTGKLAEAKRETFNANAFSYSRNSALLMLFNYDIHYYLTSTPDNQYDYTIQWGGLNISQSICGSKLTPLKTIFNLSMDAYQTKDMSLLRSDSIQYICSTTNSDGSRIAYSTEDKRLFWSDFDTAETRKDSIRLDLPIENIYYASNNDFLLLLGWRNYLLFDTRARRVIDTINIYPISKLYSNAPIAFDDSGWTAMFARDTLYKFYLPYFDNTSTVDLAFASKDTAFQGDSIVFSAYSNRDCDSVKWDFGDGSGALSSNAVHSYSEVGDYQPKCLFYRDGAPVTVQTKSAIHVLASMNPDFVCTPERGVFPLSVSFANQANSRAKAFLWEFGDGQTSREANPTHVYVKVGTYSPKLTVWNSDSLKQVEIKHNLINVVRQEVGGIKVENEITNFKGRCAWSHRSQNGNIYSKIYFPDTLIIHRNYLGYPLSACKSFLADTSNILAYCLSRAGSALMPFCNIGKSIYYIVTDTNKLAEENVNQYLYEYNIDSKRINKYTSNPIEELSYQFMHKSAANQFIIGASGSENSIKQFDFGANGVLLKQIKSPYALPEPPETPNMDCSSGRVNRIVFFVGYGASVVETIDNNGTLLSQSNIPLESGMKYFSIASNDVDLHFIAGRNDTTQYGYVAAINDNGELIAYDSAKNFLVQKIVYMENDVFAVIGSMDGLMAVGFVGKSGKIVGLTKLNNRPGNLLYAEYEGNGKLLVSGYLSEGEEISYVAELLPDFSIVSVSPELPSTEAMQIEVFPMPVSTNPSLRITGANAGSPICLTVYDIFGNVRLIQSFEPNQGTNIRTLPIELEAGIYFVSASQGTKSARFRFVKE